MRPTALPIAEIEAFLAETDLFGVVAPEALGAMARAFEPVMVEAGEVVIAEGDPAGALYLVQVGRLRIRRSAAEADESLPEVGVGETVGELALVTDRPRSATVVASRDSRLLRLPLESFEALAAEHPATLRAVTTQVVSHLERDRPSGHRLGVVAVVPLRDTELTRRAIDEVVTALDQSPGTVAVGLDDVGDDVRYRINRLEHGHDLVVAVVDPEPGPWRASCIHQADRVVLVADAETPPSPTPVEEQLNQRQAVLPVQVELVLAHPPGTTSPSRSGAWLADRSVTRHHQLRVGDQGHAGRVARLVTDNGIGLVCSGGGARAMAEIGVLEVLDELDIPVDAITGTSAGAIVGGSYALGWPAKRVRWTLRHHLVESSRPVEPTVPMVSLSSGGRMAERLKAVCGELELEDTWIDFACVSTNLSTRSRVVHRTGPAWRAVRASMSLPGVFPPVAHDDDLLIDGGVVDNLPVGVLLDRHPGSSVVAVDVGVHRDLTAGDLPHDTVVHGWPLLRDRLHPWRRSPEIAGIASVMTRLTELGSRDSDDFGAADLIIRPEVQEFGLLEFDRFDDLVARGRAEGEAMVAPWWKTVSYRYSTL